MEKATFGAGCFWGVEAAFRHVDGVTDTAVGYLGGSKDSPTYDDVCSDETGHAEVVEVTFDPARVSFEQLLDVFWQIHDPTTPGRQGPDVGSQYRSAIFTHSADQEATARASLATGAGIRAFHAPDRDGDIAGHHLLACRGLSPAVPGTPGHGLLPHLRQARKQGARKAGPGRAGRKPDGRRQPRPPYPVQQAL